MSTQGDFSSRSVPAYTLAGSMYMELVIFKWVITCAVCASVLCIHLLWLYSSFLILTWKIWHAHLPYVGFICGLKFLKTQGKFNSVSKCWSTVNEIKCSTIFLHMVFFSRLFFFANISKQRPCTVKPRSFRPCCYSWFWRFSMQISICWCFMDLVPECWVKPVNNQLFRTQEKISLQLAWKSY